MFHVFEALDELVAMVEEARGIPMSTQCMVPRSDALLLLDEIREALPKELDDAQDVLDQRDGLIDEANSYAETTKNETNAQVDQQLASARADADRMIAEAKDKADRMVAEASNNSAVMITDAEHESTRLLHEAQREYESVTERAHNEAERLIAKGNDDYEQSVAAARAEQARLVSESEVVKTSRDEAQRIVDAAHAESDRLRGECDIYVDNKLAEFESILNSTSREVLNGRKTLRARAGVAERSADESFEDYVPGARVYDANLDDDDYDLTSPGTYNQYEDTNYADEYDTYPPEAYEG